MIERVREENKLRRPKRERKLPQLLTEDDMKAFFKGISKTEHENMTRFLLYTGKSGDVLLNITLGRRIYADEHLAGAAVVAADQLYSIAILKGAALGSR